LDILVAYDIADTDGPGRPRLRRVHDRCCAYCQKVQFSVFECRLSPDRLQRLIGELRDIIDPELDSVMVYRLEGDPRGRRIQIGRSAAHELGEPWIL